VTQKLEIIRKDKSKATEFVVAFISIKSAVLSDPTVEEKEKK